MHCLQCLVWVVALVAEEVCAALGSRLGEDLESTSAEAVIHRARELCGTPCYMHCSEVRGWQCWVVFRQYWVACRQCWVLQCSNCLDKPIFGGQNKKKQACVQRKCLQMISGTSSTYLMHLQHLPAAMRLLHLLVLYWCYCTHTVCAARSAAGDSKTDTKRQRDDSKVLLTSHSAALYAFLFVLHSHYAASMPLCWPAPLPLHLAAPPPLRLFLTCYSGTALASSAFVSCSPPLQLVYNCLCDCLCN